MSKDTSKLEEIRKALGLDSYGAKCTGLDCSHEIGVDHYIITDVHLADLLAWHREEVSERLEKALPSKRPARGFEDKPESTWKDFGYEQAIADIRASLEVEDE